MATPVCSIKGVRVKYRRRVAVDGVSLDLFSGDGLALLGMNGAGKSSIVRTLMGIMPLKFGSISLLGSTDPRKRFHDVGYCPEDGMPPEFLSIEEYFDFLVKLKVANPDERRSAVVDVMAVFDLPVKRRIGELSKGMARRVVLAQAFLGNPKLLVLDEPLNGLDPIMISNLRDRIVRFRQEGGALLYSSHLLSEVERCCSRAIIIKEGRVVGLASVDEFSGKYGSLELAFKALVGGQHETSA